MTNLSQDLRYAFRQFRKSPGFAFTAVLSLALGIGATTAIFSVVHGILLDPYPYKDADRMVHVELRDKSGRGPLLFVNGTEYPELRKVSSIDDVFLQTSRQEVLTGDRLPVSVNVGLYSPNLFTYMGIPPLVGRQFGPGDAPGGNASPVVVLSYLFWQRQFGADRSVIGRSIELEHKLYTVIGVLPPRFTWGDSDVYLTGMPTADPRDYWLAFVKLKPDVSHPAVAAELQVLVDAFTSDDIKDHRKDMKVAIVTLNEQVLGTFAGTIVVLFGAVVALLVIGCANVSILMLARGTARQHELSVRASLGASRGRLIRQLLSESVLLSFTGAALGVVAAYKGVEAITAMLPLYGAFPHEATIHVNGTVLAFSAAVALLTGILFGISPAWHLSRPEISQLIQASGGRQAGAAHGRHTHRILIAAQVALTIVLMAGAGASMKAFLTLTRTPLGFDPDHVIAMNVAVPRGANPTWQERMNASEAVLQTVSQVPGVTSASISTTWFPPFGAFTAKFEIRSKPSLTDAETQLALISPQAFATLRIPLLRGRVFDDAEVRRAAHLAVVNQAFVKQYLPDRDPIGQFVRSPTLRVEQPSLVLAQAPDDWLQVIGVVADARNDGLNRPTKPAIFLPHSFVLPPDQALFVRTIADPDATMRPIKERLRQLNAEMVVSQDHPLNWWLETQGWGKERVVARLFALFAVLALALAATGLYSVVSYAVTQRTQEVGIRMALGAPRANIVRLVLGSTAAMLGAGMLVGLGLSIALSRVAVSWAGGSSRDPLTLLSAAGLLAVVAAIACIRPAWRAATIDPMRALRTE